MPGFRKGIEEDDYFFYDDFRECKEVLIVGSSNSGKSSLINALNNGTQIAKVAKKSAKTESINFYLCS
jgi:GTP-binding protein EngB required for normal cell division